MRNSIVLVLVFFSQLVFSQGAKLLKGKVVVKDATPEGVKVVNLVSEKEVITNAKGEFSIWVEPEDLLVFSATHLDFMRKFIETEDYNSSLLVVEMTSKANQLEEVEVHNYSGINAVSLGILSKPAKEYTPAERRLKTATGLYPQANVGTMMGGSIGLDPVLNWISGRTAMLKKEVEVEQKEFLLHRLGNLYEEEYYTNRLKIKKESIKAFQYYVIYDEKFVNALNSKNNSLATFLTGGLALEFNKLSNEK
jgi:predicted RND superfamily exporter protein